MSGNFTGFPIPYVGASSFLSDAAREAAQDLSEGIVSRSPTGGQLRFEAFETELQDLTGSLVFVPNFSPSDGTVLSLSAVVLETITGTLSQWALGRFGNTNAFFGSVGLAAGTSVVTQPLSGSASVGNMILSAEDGQFTGGRVRITAHLLRTVPSAP